jgi:predicted SAM-dependent methyltransferase
LANLLLAKDRLNTDERFHVMRMIFGGHVDAHDYHLVGLNEDFLTEYLKIAGFGAKRKVDTFDIFDDGSNLTFKDELISLNLIAKKQ